MRIPMTLSVLVVSFGCSELTPGRYVRADEPVRREKTHDPALSARVDQILWWLPVNTQTLIVKNVALKSGEPPDDMDLLMTPPCDTSLLRKAIPCYRAISLNVVLQIEGLCCFRKPQEFGMLMYEGATVSVTKDSIDSKTCSSLLGGASHFYVFRGIKVSVFDTKMPMQESRIWACIPQKDVIIFATDRGYLETLLQRIGSRSSTRALPATLQEWNYINKSHSVWGMRHYDSNDVSSDPTSPLAKQVGLFIQDEGAVGMAFGIDRGKNAYGVVHVTSNVKAIARYRDYWNHEQLPQKPQWRELSPGVLEIFQAQSDGHINNVFKLLLFCVLGHAFVT